MLSSELFNIRYGSNLPDWNTSKLLFTLVTHIGGYMVFGMYFGNSSEIFAKMIGTTLHTAKIETLQQKRRDKERVLILQ